MRVRISYSVELDEVPDKVASMVGEATKKLEQQLVHLQAVMSTLSEGLSVQQGATNLLDAVRLNLGDVDAMLNDAHNIMGGYISAMNPDSEASTPVVPPHPTPPEAPSDV